MPGHDLAKELLEAAKSDLKAFEHMRGPEIFDERVFGFHAQQEIEKALKVWRNLLGRRPMFTHDLSMLLNALEAEDEDVEAYCLSSTSMPTLSVCATVRPSWEKVPWTARLSRMTSQHLLRWLRA